MDFKPFPKMDRLGNAQMSITQKIHGSNAQIVIVPANEESDYTNLITVDGQEYELKVGKRTSWITPESDNFGFARFVYDNKEEFIRKLGVGQHHGEWAGPGINSGEGLTEKTFVLFAHWAFPPDRELPPQTRVVPVLYSGPFDLGQLNFVMNDLKSSGSKLVPGFMRPEGVVVTVKGERYKVVFDTEETQWKKGSSHGQPKVERSIEDDGKYDYLLQPIRMEKLLSRDSKYLENYPASIKDIVRDYAQDLTDENFKIDGAQDNVKAIIKVLGPKLYLFVKDIAQNKKDKEFS